MAVRLITVGKLSAPFLIEAEAEYTKRLRPFLKIGFTELPNSKSKDPPITIEDEGKQILTCLKLKEQVIILDEGGDTFSSAGFAKFLERLLNGGDAAFVIGGAFGVSKAIRARATRCVSLSPLTFTYQFARIILIEQLYRANCINRGVAYHKQ